MQTKIKINLPGNLFNKTSLNFDFCLLTYTLKVRQFYLNWGITSTEVPLYNESAQETFDPGTQFYLGLVICHG